MKWKSWLFLALTCKMAAVKKRVLASILLGNEYLRAKIALLEVRESIT